MQKCSFERCIFTLLSYVFLYIYLWFFSPLVSVWLLTSVLFFLFKLQISLFSAKFWSFKLFLFLFALTGHSLNDSYRCKVNDLSIDDNHCDDNHKISLISLWISMIAIRTFKFSLSFRRCSLFNLICFFDWAKINSHTKNNLFYC